MISEKIVASQFHSLWEESLPLLTPTFVRLFNEAYRDDLSEYTRNEKLNKITIGHNIEKHDLVAELSFKLAKEANNAGIPVANLKAKKIIEAVINETIKFLPHYNLEKDIPNNYEICESFKLAEQYEKFFKLINAKNIEFSPSIRGAGFMGICYADLAIDDTLYEIKTVNRNLSSNDIRQLLLYLSLQASEGNQKWINGGFFNPRRALHYKFPIDHLIYHISGGKSTHEVFQSITDFLSREIEVDTFF
ncbi:MAG: hypothetical protein RLZZ422_2429 [Pseudomonadota bacterium]|jgi:hypothetical protein